MALSNKQRIGQALEELKPALQPFVEKILAEAAQGPRKAEIKQALDEIEARIIDGKIHWDIQALLKMMIKLWGPMFTHQFDRHERSRTRSLIGEANDIRNRHAHDMPFSYEDTYRDIDTLGRVADAIGHKKTARKLKEMAKGVMRVQFQEEARVSTRKAAAMEGTPLAALKPWREVIAPHSDVAKGDFLEAEFVADLHAVHHGKAGTEYGDPREFYARTYLTEGLQDLLKRSLTRLSSGGGSPVLELKTNFGGGKTHSLLALYHLFGETPANSLAGMDALLAELDVQDSPVARRVVIAGHQLGVNQPRKKGEGIEIRTLWGEVAYQLGGAVGYEKVRSSDESGTNPGAEILAELMREAGPCLILIDEWVSYLRETVDATGLCAGSFESNFGFAQSLTEAAKVVPHALVVASLPASQIEMGGPKGVEAFNQLSNLFKRVATPWQSTRTEEGYEIVRRRLFESSMEYPARDAVVKAYYELYTSDKGSFPSNCSEQEYRRKLEACYPIHPELFDKLDGAWSTLEKFQKTRGVLRFMAAVISELWQRGDRNLLIMPASVTLDSPRVSSVIKEVLPAGGSWDGVISTDIDGQGSQANIIDSDNSSLGKYSACRRVARSIFMAAAPTSGANRGVDDEHLLLSCVQPGENPEKFGDALRRLSDRATYLYRDGARSWFALQPSVSRLAQDRTKDYLEGDEVNQEIIKRLRKWEGRSVFPGGAQLAQIPADVEDEASTRLVILPPTATTAKTIENTPGLTKAEEILTQAANRPRTHRNGLVFLAPDEAQLQRLREAVAAYLAWQSIERDQEALELTNHDKKQAAQKFKEHGDTVTRRIGEAWSHLLIPTVKDPTGATISWQVVSSTEAHDKIRGALKKLTQKDLIYDQFSPFHLKRELDRHLWGLRDHITTQDVANAFDTYLFMPRLLHRDLLVEAVRNAFNGGGLLCEFFGYAEGYDDEKGTYLGLCTNKPPASVTIGSTLLVKPDVAMAQGAAALVGKESEPTPKPSPGNPPSSPEPGDKEPPQPVISTRFYGSVEIAPDKVSSSVKKVVDEVVQHLSAKYGSKLKISLEIEAENESGFDEGTVRIVSENANTLGFSENGFE
jgi:predicted AAA+ superfamily ATPase